MALFEELEFDALFTRIGASRSSESAPGELPQIAWATTETVVLESTGAVLLEVRLAAPHTEAIVATIGVEGASGNPGELTLGVDLALPSNTVTIPAGQTTAQLTVMVIEDDIQETDETAQFVIVTAVEDSKAALPAPIGLQVTTLRVNANDEPRPKVSLSMQTANVAEGGSLSGLRVELDQIWTSPVVVTIAAQAGSTAVAGDYAFQNQVTVPAGSLSATVAFTASSDNEVEGSETVILRIVGAQGADMGANIQTTITISDSTVVVLPEIGFIDETFSLAEATPGTAATVRVGVLNPLDATFQGLMTFDIVHRSDLGTATLDVDFTVSHSSITLSEEAQEAVLTLTVLDDGFYEGTEGVILEVVSTSSNAEVDGSKALASGVILDNEAAPSNVPPIGWQLSGGEYQEDAGLQFATLELEAPYSRRIGVTVEILGAGTGEGQLELGVDLIWTASYFEIPVTNTTYQMPFEIVADALVEGPETATFRIVSAIEVNGNDEEAPITRSDFGILVGDTGNTPEGGIVTSGTTGSTVHAYFETSTDVNKELFVDAMRAHRDPRPGTMISSTFQHTNAPSYRDIVWTHKDWASWHLNTGKSATLPASRRPDNKLFALTNIDFSTFEPRPLYTDTNGVTHEWTIGANWCNQTYDQPGHLMRDCDFESPAYGPIDGFNPDDGIPPFTADMLEPRYPLQAEHDQYSHTANAVIWQRNTSRFIGGHAYYIANRPFAYDQYPPDNAPAIRPQLAMVDNCHIIDTGAGSRKGSNAIEVFDYGSPTFPSTLIVRNSTIIDGYNFWVQKSGGNEVHLDLNQPQGPGWGRGRGLVNVSGYQYCEVPQVANQSGIDDGYDVFNSPGGFGAGPAFMKLALIKNSVLITTDPLHNFSGFGGVKDVVFEDCVLACDGVTQPIVFNENGYIAGNNEKRGVPRTETVTFQNCRMRGISILLKRIAGLDMTITPPQDLRNRSITYDCLTGAVLSDVAYDPLTDYTDVAAIINEIDPFEGLVDVPLDFSWGIPGVTV